MISVLTVYGQYNPFKEIQKHNLEQYTDVEYEHLTIQGGPHGSFSHGAGLDELSFRAKGNIIVTLDADAFPVRPWTYLLGRLEDFGAVAVHHPRFNYGHPSFFATYRATVKGLSWRRSGQFDVGRVLSEEVETKRGGISFLYPTSCFVKNPNPLDPPIGAVYEETIFHNWYTSRMKKKANPDGISSLLIQQSINHALAKYAQ